MFRDALYLLSSNYTNDCKLIEKQSLALTIQTILLLYELLLRGLSPGGRWWVALNPVHLFYRPRDLEYIISERFLRHSTFAIVGIQNMAYLTEGLFTAILVLDAVTAGLLSWICSPFVQDRLYSQFSEPSYPALSLGMVKPSLVSILVADVWDYRCLLECFMQAFCCH